ncbi:hypothetical protein L3Q82_010821, partial [Scortum barcoo]
SATLCFTETWLSEHIPDTSLHLPGFHLIWADRTELSGKKRGGGICFYINEAGRPDKECGATTSRLIVLGDFNRANLSHELPNRQQIKCPTRDTNILDHCYTTLKDAYCSVPWAALGLSDHCLVHLILAYRQKLKSAKPVVKTVRRWTTEAKLELQACFDCTDWSVFDAATTDLHELTDTVTSYISFCEEMCVANKYPSSPTTTTNPGFHQRLRQLHQAKEEAYRSGDRVLYNQARNTLTKEIKVAKRSHTEKLKNNFSVKQSSVSVEEPGGHYQLQETIPPHCTEPSPS